MMRMKGKIQHIVISLGIILFLMAPAEGFAQQDPMYTQYMFNTQTINPAYAGSWESIGFMIMSRMQWAGIEGAPSTQTFSFQMPLRNERIGIGANLVNDRIGLEQRLMVSLDYSYKIIFDGYGNLRMGLKAGFSSYSNNLTDHILYDPVSDPSFIGDIDNKFMPNMGIGFLFDNQHFYVGISMPKLLNTSVNAVNDKQDNSFPVKGELRHFFATAGYLYPIDNSIKLKPTIMLKSIAGAPLQLDLSANVLLKDKFWLGALYRTGDSFGFIAQWVFDKKLRVGYAVDFSTSELRKFHYGSHEIMISYEFKFLERDVISPRYF